MSKNFYITTPIYYPSGAPHMGHAYSSILTDVIARYKRIEGYKVHFLTGTDEHGLKIQKAAEKNKTSPKEFCDKISKTFKDLTSTLNLSNDDFIRTTENRHIKGVQDIWNELVKSGDIYLSKYKGWYSVSDEAYYSEEEITNKDKKKYSIVSGSEVEWVEEDSYFFKLSKWEKPLLNLYNKNKSFILPESRKNEVVNFVKSGLQDLSVSRTSFSWGIKVPNNDKHVIYVWLDALTNYLTALNYPNKKDALYKNFWPASLHVIGKDILRFHAVYWPAFLLAAKIEVPKRIFGHGWILAGKEKMSKSKGNILNPLEIIKNYGLDELRYYLMKEVSHGHDGSVSIENLEKCINADLANNYGNLCQRLFVFIKNNCEEKIPQYNVFKSEDRKLLDSFSKILPELRKFMDNQDINNYLKTVVERLFEVNKYVNDNQPWALKKTDAKRMNTILYTSLESLRKISILLFPVIPTSSENVLNTLGISKNDININNYSIDKHLKPATKLKGFKILFKKHS